MKRRKERNRDEVEDEERKGQKNKGEGMIQIRAYDNEAIWRYNNINNINNRNILIAIYVYDNVI